LAAATKTRTSDAQCLDCHGVTSLQASDGRFLFVDAGRMASSLHSRAGLNCVDCHADIKNFTDFPHPAKLKPADCASCHTGQAEDIARGIHRPGKGSVSNPVPGCAGCHGSHDIRRKSDPQSSVNQARLARTCGRCHAGAEKNFGRGKIHVASHSAANFVARAVKIIYIILIAAVVSLSLIFILADVLARGRLP
jgi:hypothetical protein